MCADSLILTEIRRVIERHLSAALIEATGLVRDMKEINPDKVIESLNQYFEPYSKESVVQDLLGDSLSDFHRDLSSQMRAPEGPARTFAEKLVRFREAAE